MGFNESPGKNPWKEIMKLTPLENKIAEIITPVLIDLGVALVSVKIIGEGGSRNLQIMAEDPTTHNLGVEKCAEVSRAVSAILDVEDPIEGHYRLEVSSPGIDRVLLKPEDFQTWAGFEARVETEMPLASGQRRFKGVLKGIENNVVRINTEQGEAEIPFADIAKAKLLLTDQLIKATAKT
jgi:ribosome maturation factor RimP